MTATGTALVRTKRPVLTFEEYIDWLTSPDFDDEHNEELNECLNERNEARTASRAAKLRIFWNPRIRAKRNGGRKPKRI
jgi:hypothetical protein